VRALTKRITIRDRDTPYGRGRAGATMKIVRPVIDSIAVERLRVQTLGVLSEGTGRASDETKRALDAGIDRAVECAEPGGEYVTSSVVEIVPGGVETADGFIASPMFARIAGRASDGARVMFALATLGEALDEELRKKGSLLETFVLDAVASELAEIVADMVEEVWKNEASLARREGSLRMSPGYCDWPLTGQNVLFTALDASAIGVRLSPSYLMIPSKSVSSAAVVASHVPLLAPCVTCPKADCPFRRMAFDAFLAGAASEPTATGEQG
jgi:hypothetical protein